MNESAVARAAQGPPRTRAAQFAPCAAAELPEELALLVLAVEPPVVRELLRHVFSALTILLDRLHFLEEGLRQGGVPVGAHLILRLVHERARAMVKFIDEEGLTLEGLDAPLRAALDGASFAVSHELRRVFAGELGELVVPRHLTRAEAARAAGLLANCFQQATAALAQVFEPTLDVASLFSDVRERREQSLRLYQDLLSLYEVVNEADQTGAAGDALARQLRAFREESLHFLMYRDWEEFERQADEIVAACAQSTTARPRLHGFACYLRTLIGHVRLRGVLHELFCAPADTRAHQPT
ncbi:MAG TPA: hypothetical protein VF546_03565 [Pyrinomonadaceae bacterium]